MRLNPFFMPALSIALLFGTVFGAQAAGVWSTSGRDTAALDALTPADVKGWMTLQQISAGIPIPPDELYSLMGIPSDIPAETALKDLEGVVPDFEVSVLRERLTAWQSGDAALPDPIVLAPTGAPTGAPTLEPTAAPLATSTSIPAPTATPLPTDSPAGSPATPEGGTPTCDIRGKMTLQDVSAGCGVALDRLIEAAGLPGDTAADTVLKDLINQGVLTDLETFKTTVAGLQDETTP